METLRFLHITTHFPPAYLGGDAKFVEYLSLELAKAGHEVHVLHNPAVFELLRKERSASLGDSSEAGVNRHTYKSSAPLLETLMGLNFGNTHSTRREFERLLNEVRPDVVHWHNTKGFYGEPIRARRATTLYTAHDFFAVCPRSSLLRPGYKICVKPFLCQICLMRWRTTPQLWRMGSRRPLRFPEGTTIISPSQFLAKRLEEDGIVSHRILRNFVPDIRAMVGDRRPGNFLVYLGLLEKHKGPLTLLEAFARSRDHQSFELWLAGDGSLKESIKSRVDELNLSQRIKVPGFTPLEKIAPILRESAAMIVPSESFENAPLAVLEAFSSGIPVVGACIGGLPEILGSESGSMVFQPGNVEQLSEIITNLWNRRSELPMLGHKARAVYERDFHPREHLKKYMRIISDAES